MKLLICNGNCHSMITWYLADQNRQLWCTWATPIVCFNFSVNIILLKKEYVNIIMNTLGIGKQVKQHFALILVSPATKNVEGETWVCFSGDGGNRDGVTNLTLSFLTSSFQHEPFMLNQWYLVICLICILCYEEMMCFYRLKKRKISSFSYLC